MRRITTFLAIVALAWGAGLLVFVSALHQARQPSSVKAEGVVVYTGVGGQRISTGMALLSSGAAERLLISGVNPDIGRDELRRLWTGEPEDFDRYVDLGREAESTVGNAIEVRDWANSHGFHRLILVTSDYHMPRAILETRDQLPDAEIVAYPVQSGYLSEHGRPANAKAWRLLAVEYSKYLWVRAKTLAPF